MFKQKSPQSKLHAADRAAAYILFIATVSTYFYWSQNFAFSLLERLPDDPQIPLFIMGLGICWAGSVLLIGQQLRYYLKQAPGWRTYFVALSPLLIIPAIWALATLFGYVEVS